MPMSSYPSGGMVWFASSSTPNETADTTGTPFTSNGGGYSLYAVPVLTGVDVTTPAEEIGPNKASLTEYPAEPTVVVAGDNVIDGSIADAQQDAPDAPSQRLACQLALQLTQLAATEQGYGANAPLYGVVDAGVQSNLVVQDGGPYGDGIDGNGDGVPGGQSLVGRLDRTVPAEPGVGTVILDEGLEDVLWEDGSAADEALLIDNYRIIQQQLNAFGIQVYLGTLTPVRRLLQQRNRRRVQL